MAEAVARAGLVDIRATIDRRFLAWTALWTAVSWVALGVASAIIPNPVFGRQIAAEPFAIVVWLLSGPVAGALLATYTVPPRASMPARPLALRLSPEGPDGGAATESRTSTLATIGGFGTFFAIGCPICNKVVLLALGTGGALDLYAPIQPWLGAASLALMLGTLAWRLRRRAEGDACPA